MILRRTTGIVAGLVVVGAVVAASPAGATDPPPAAAGPGRLSTVTLLTGDQVRVVDGKVAGIRMAPGRETHLPGTAHTLTVNVAPRDVTPVMSLLVVRDTRTGKAQGGVFFDGETATFTVPAGDYRWRKATVARIGDRFEVRLPGAAPQGPMPHYGQRPPTRPATR